MIIIVGDHYTKRIPRAISTPIHLDNVACHGTEDTLLNCTYHTDTSEDSHSEDIWIDCSPTPTTPMAPMAPTNAALVTENESHTELIVAVVALVFSIIVIAFLVGYILWKKRSKKRAIR